MPCTLWNVYCNLLFDLNKSSVEHIKWFLGKRFCLFFPMHCFARQHTYIEWKATTILSKICMCKRAFSTCGLLRVIVHLTRALYTSINVTGDFGRPLGHQRDLREHWSTTFTATAVGVLDNLIEGSVGPCGFHCRRCLRECP